MNSDLLDTRQRRFPRLTATQPQESNGKAVSQHGIPLPATDPKPTVDTGHEPVCATCPHPWNSHDQIAARYCTATATGGHSRSCVCTNK
ncbi:RGCVC family protein [Actinocrispum wychmicini]|uniref:Uncharacterized protein n=1 Tax=Actinocrispum wychmicini TaxID=1213861 RepID=A0A4R2J6Y0_9PSEU|nr:RGCVC family protein [Actinocrispum wychmicini]TCO54254.1 hypothetical protein EV192_109234 [Actinocrispum wychmicini]